MVTDKPSYTRLAKDHIPKHFNSHRSLGHLQGYFFDLVVVWLLPSIMNRSTKRENQTDLLALWKVKVRDRRKEAFYNANLSWRAPP